MKKYITYSLIILTSVLAQVNCSQKQEPKEPIFFNKQEPRPFLPSENGILYGSVFAYNKKRNLLGGAVYTIQESNSKQKICILKDLYIEHAYRRSGNGSRILQETFATLRDQGCKEVTWEVAPFGTHPISVNRIIHFYQKNGAELVTQSPHPEHNSEQPLMIKRRKFNSEVPQGDQN